MRECCEVRQVMIVGDVTCDDDGDNDDNNDL